MPDVNDLDPIYPFMDPDVIELSALLGEWLDLHVPLITMTSEQRLAQIHEHRNTQGGD